MKTFLSILVLVSSSTNFAQAAPLVCTTKSGSSLTFKDDGNQTLSLQFGRDTYVGHYVVSDWPSVTPVLGAKALTVQLGQTNGCWPNSSFSVNLVLVGPEFKNSYGWIAGKMADGSALFASGVECNSVLAKD
jgi:hypothetical protein